MFIFGFKNDNEMFTMEKIYERFGVLMESRAVLEHPGMDYNGVCRMLRVCPAELEEILWRELGMTGQEVFDASKNSFGNGCKNY